MLVNVGLLLLYAILLRFEGKNLDVFGFLPPGKRLFQFLIGFSLTAALSVIINTSFALAAGFSWELSDTFGWRDLLNGAYGTFNSVLFEELVFRMYLMYKLFQFLGETKAVLLTSACFGAYHWFSFGILGNYPMMMWVFAYTGLWGLMFAYSYTRTGSILMPIGLHWGWNFFDQLIFNQKGTGLFKPITGEGTAVLDQLSGFLIVSLPPIVFAAVWIWLLKKRTPVQVNR